MKSDYWILIAVYASIITFSLIMAGLISFKSTKEKYRQYKLKKKRSHLKVVK